MTAAAQLAIAPHIREFASFEGGQDIGLEEAAGRTLRQGDRRPAAARLCYLSEG